MVDLLVDAGLDVDASDTPVETVHRTAARFRLAEEGLMTLARAEYDELFAPPGVEAAAAPPAGARLPSVERQVRNDVFQSLTFTRRVLTLVSTASLRRRRFRVSASRYQVPTPQIGVAGAS